MEEKQNIAESEPEKKWYHNLTNARFHQSILMISVITAFLTLPVFIIVYRYVPKIELPFGDGFRLDHILTFLIIFSLVFVFVRTFRLYIYIIAIIGLIGMTFTNFTGIYTLEDLFYDYKELLFDLSQETVKTKNEKVSPDIEIELELRESIDYTNPMVREYAVNSAVKNFKEQESLASNYKLIQYFSIFKEIVNSWEYVNDPSGEDYYSKASETIRLLQSDGKFKGDCDDYSILMAACIKAVGGEIRLVRATIVTKSGEEVGHLYPEVKVGTEQDMKEINYLIKTILFPEEASGKDLHYYLDPKGYIWLNFDYNDHYPGGRYQSEIRNSTIRV
ncbi:MAG: transglutaminase domain-containing protein [Crocinitomicaceae bacterium]